MGPKSFYQTNSAQAYELYKVARRFADLRTRRIRSTTSIPVRGRLPTSARHAVRRLWASEYVPEAIADAKVNSELNGIRNTTFYAGDMKAVLDDCLRGGERASGCHHPRPAAGRRG